LLVLTSRMLVGVEVLPTKARFNRPLGFITCWSLTRKSRFRRFSKINPTTQQMTPPDPGSKRRTSY
jgi:hypothetical protein